MEIYIRKSFQRGVTRQRSSMAIPPPNTAVLLSNSRTPEALICVLSSVTPPPRLPRKRLVPWNVIGNRNAAMALVSCVSPSDVLFMKRLC